MLWLCIAIAAACVLVALGAGLVIGYAIGRGARTPRSLESARVFLASKAAAPPPPPSATEEKLPPEYRTKFEF